MPSKRDYLLKGSYLCFLIGGPKSDVPPTNVRRAVKEGFRRISKDTDGLRVAIQCRLKGIAYPRC